MIDMVISHIDMGYLVTLVQSMRPCRLPSSTRAFCSGSSVPSPRD